jgi:hypothetical protein
MTEREQRMLTITLQGTEMFDEATETFSSVGDIVLELEHSLLSLSKWESKFQKPFLAANDKTAEEILGYVKCMILTPNFDESLMERFTSKDLDAINNYINSSESATTFGQLPKQRGRGETITSELIYYWMVAFNVPFVCETWHLNRLFSLIRICNIKNSKPEKMSKHEMAQRNRELNEKRKAELNTKG